MANLLPVLVYLIARPACRAKGLATLPRSLSRFRCGSFAEQLVRSLLRFQPRRLDAGNRTYFILVRRIAGNTAGAQQVAAGVADYYATRIGDHASAACRGQHSEKLRSFCRAAGERARTEAHAECAP